MIFPYCKLDRDCLRHINSPGGYKFPLETCITDAVLHFRKLFYSSS